MKYCTHCGAQIEDEAVVCVKCGCAVKPAPTTSSTQNIFVILIKIFMVLGCLSTGWTLIPLIWCIPMTITAFRKLDAGEPLSTAFKVCTLLFVSLVAGILMLCIDESKIYKN